MFQYWAVYTFSYVFSLNHILVLTSLSEHNYCKCTQIKCLKILQLPLVIFFISICPCKIEYLISSFKMYPQDDENWIISIVNRDPLKFPTLWTATHHLNVIVQCCQLWPSQQQTSHLAGVGWINGITSFNKLSNYCAWFM